MVAISSVMGSHPCCLFVVLLAPAARVVARFVRVRHHEHAAAVPKSFRRALLARQLLVLPHARVPGLAVGLVLDVLLTRMEEKL